MLSEYNTLPPLYPVSQPFISRFSVHAVDVYESPGDASANGYDDLKRPAYTASGRRFFSRRLSSPLLSNPLLARKNEGPLGLDNPGRSLDPAQPGRETGAHS